VGIGKLNNPIGRLSEDDRESHNILLARVKHDFLYEERDNVKKYLLFFLLILVFTFTSNVAVLAEEKSEQCDKATGQCFSCHGKKDYFITRDSVKISLFVEENKFKATVHGVFECKVCHGDSDQEHSYGKELRDKVSKQCSNCHTGSGFEYSRSIHSGNKDNLPNCVSCHGSHYIAPIDDKTSFVSGANIATTCTAKCHQIQGIEFTESFHGKAVALGGKNAPSCVTCHGSHRILSKNNLADITNPKNKPSLCARCHVGGALGVGTSEHYEVKATGYGKSMYHVKTKMPWLIIAVMTIFLVHIILDLIHRIRRNIKVRRH
jgi:hypothetical protein